jgi:lysophospholipid hydrolase
MPNTPHLGGNGGQPAVENGLTENDSRLHSVGVLDGPGSNIPPISLDPSSPGQSRRPKMLGRAASHSAHPDIIARATVDTTIAIIPASAFRRLIRIFPKATSHIVHVILSRFQRVTLAHAFDYLGLTGEVLQTEKSMTKYTTCQLPNILRGDAL